jgi:hypothetical protein
MVGQIKEGFPRSYSHQSRISETLLYKAALQSRVFEILLLLEEDLYGF